MVAAPPMLLSALWDIPQKTHRTQIMLGRMGEVRGMCNAVPRHAGACNLVRARRQELEDTRSTKRAHKANNAIMQAKE